MLRMEQKEDFSLGSQFLSWVAGAQVLLRLVGTLSQAVL